MNKDGLILNSRLWIPLSAFTESELDNLKNSLTLYPRVYKTFNPSATSDPVQMYTIHGGMIGIPRHYGLINYYDKGMIDLRTDEINTINFEFKGKLWDTQQGPVDKIIKELTTNVSNGALLNMPCGAGKTVSSLYLIANFKAPTMVITHDEGLMHQWIEEAKKFLNITDEDIGIVKQDRCIFRGKKIVFASTQSLHARLDDYSQDLFSYPTLVIYDEVHRTGAKTFCSWMNKIRAKYRVGLSATIRRKDDMEDIFYWHIGDIGATGVANKMVPNIYMIYLPLMCPELRNKRGMSLKPTMISRLAGTLTPKGQTKAVSAPNKISIKRNFYLCDDIIKALNKDRRVLVLSNRIPQLEEIEKFIKARTSCSIGWYIGGSSSQVKKQAKDCQLMLATYAMAAEGMDSPSLDTLVLATPISDVEQAVGRILRYKDGKKTPFVLDYIDPNEAFKNMVDSRQKFYRDNNYPITRIVKS